MILTEMLFARQQMGFSQHIGGTFEHLFFIKCAR